MKSFNFFRNCMFKIAVLAIAVLSLNSQAEAQLSGTYTINKTGGDFIPDNNFKSFNEAVDSLESQGVSGPVTIDIADGTYIEQILITNIPNAKIRKASRYKRYVCCINSWSCRIRNL